jgi:hypothetical protein
LTYIKNQSTLVFVEVKTVIKILSGFPEEAVDELKMNTLKRRMSGIFRTLGYLMMTGRLMSSRSVGVPSDPAPAN